MCIRQKGISNTTSVPRKKWRIHLCWSWIHFWSAGFIKDELFLPESDFVIRRALRFFRCARRSDFFLTKGVVLCQRGPLSSPLYYYCARRFKFSRGKNVGSASLHSTVRQILLENILGMKYKNWNKI